MKTITKYTLGLLALAALVGCKDKMIELNTNPGTIGTTNPEYMFLGATSGWDYFGRDWPAAQGSIMHTMQYSSRDDFGSNPYRGANGEEGAVASSGTTERYWGGYYSRGYKLYSLVNYLDKELTDPTMKSIYGEIRAISEVLGAYYAWVIFDMYGAAVYSEAFKASEGVIKPKYDLIQDKYKTIDSIVKAQIEVLVKPAPVGTISLSQYDFFYGYTWTALPAGGANYSTLGNATIQRERWVKFANAIRLKMAMRFRAKDEAHFNKVLAEVLAVPNGLMTEIADGCEFLHHKSQGDDPVDGVQYGTLNHPTAAFINAMKITNDPRLPMYVRPSNNASTMSNAYKFIATHYPDSIAQYGSLLAENNAWVGQSANPDNKSLGTFGPGMIVTKPNISFVIKNTNFVEGEPGKHPLMSPVTGKPIIWGKDSTLSWRMTSATANRYWNKNSGTNSDPQFTAQDEHEKPFVDVGLIRITTPVLSYAEQCFSFALIAAQGSGSIAGKSTNEWYETGIRAAITKLQADARRVYVRIMTNESFPLIVGVNGTTPENKKLYAATPEMIDNYIAHPKVALPAATGESAIRAIANQIWLSLHLDPQNAWGYFKLTGYPKAERFVNGKNTLPAWGDVPVQPNDIVFEQPTSGGENLYWPRRISVPTPNNLNIENYFNVQNALIKQTNPAFGIWSNTTGRIWWDVTPIK